jgi:hypothetical protein
MPRHLLVKGSSARSLSTADENTAVNKADEQAPESPFSDKSCSSPRKLRNEASLDGSVRPSSLRTLLQTPQRLIKKIASTSSGLGSKRDLGDFIEDISGIFEKRSGELHKMSMRVMNSEENLVEDSEDESSNGGNQSDSSAKYPSGCVKRRPVLTKTPSYRARNRRNATSLGRPAVLATDQDAVRRHRSVERKNNRQESQDPPGFQTHRDSTVSPHKESTVMRYKRAADFSMFSEPRCSII